jgi:hypothetical protein
VGIAGGTKIVGAFTGATAAEMTSFVLRTTDIWGMTISYIMEEMDFRSREKECGCYAVNGCITPSFIKESTGSVEIVEVICICLRSEESHICNLKVRPELIYEMEVRGLYVTHIVIPI